MPKLPSLIAGAVLLFVPTLALAKDKPEKRVQSLLACQSISANDARLVCYDQAMSSLKEAIAQGTMVLKEKNAPLALEGVVKSSGHWGGSSLWVLLDNGDRWSIQPSKAAKDPPPAGTAVKLKKTFMGTYWMSGQKLPETEAQFLGHES